VNKKLCYHRGTARLAMSVEILSTAAEQYKEITFERLAVGNVLEDDATSSQLHVLNRPLYHFLLHRGRGLLRQNRHQGRQKDAMPRLPRDKAAASKTVSLTINILM